MAYYGNGHYFRQCDLNSQPCEDLTSAHEIFVVTGPSSKLSLLAFGKNWEDITNMDYSHPKRKLYARGLSTTHGGQQIIGIVVPGLARIHSIGSTTETSSRKDGGRPLQQCFGEVRRLHERSQSAAGFHI